MKLSRTPFLLLAAAFAFSTYADERTRTLDVYWVDSEGGGSTLIVTPAGESVLIDSGNPGARDSSRIVAAAKAAGLTRIDYFLLTHYHIDHFGGAPEVAAQLPFGAIYQRAIPDSDPDGRPQSSFPVQIRGYREIAARRESLTAGMRVPLKTVPGAPVIELRCLAADKKVIDAPAGAPKGPANDVPKTVAPSDNDNSAVFLLSFGGFRLFDGGDLTWNYEAQLVSPLNRVGVVDVYQTNHHGLDVSNNPVLVQGLSPTVVVMNNGPVKGGTPAAFAAIKSARSVQATFQVHKSYNVKGDENAPAEFIANHDNLRGPDAAKCPAHLVKMTVAADAKSYTISIPATGFARTFKTKQ